PTRKAVDLDETVDRLEFRPQVFGEAEIFVELALLRLDLENRRKHALSSVSYAFLRLAITQNYRLPGPGRIRRADHAASSTRRAPFPAGQSDWKSDPHPRRRSMQLLARSIRADCLVWPRCAR